MTSYTDFGYDQFLNKQVDQTASPTENIDSFKLQNGLSTGSNAQQISADQLDYLVQSMSGSKVSGGQMTSTNGAMSIDLDQGVIAFKNGGILKAEVRKFLDDKVGLKVYNGDGTVAVNQTG